MSRAGKSGGVSLATQYTVLLVLAFVVFELLAAISVVVFLMVPMARRSADDLAGLMALSAQIWVELPPATRPIFEQELIEHHLLALRAEPGNYDLCHDHSGRLSVPRGWEVIRLPGDLESPRASAGDLMALADAVRRVGLAEPDPAAEPAVTRRKGHLAVLADPQ